MKTIICGGRNYHLSETDYKWLDDHKELEPITEVVSGGCVGADQDGEAWAKRHNIPIKQFMAAWDDKGSAAGPIRNQVMADYADMCVCFPGGKGTLDMKKKAIKAGLKTYELCMVLVYGGNQTGPSK